MCGSALDGFWKTEIKKSYMVERSVLTGNVIGLGLSNTIFMRHIYFYFSSYLILCELSL